jgi:hypothetical protein
LGVPKKKPADSQMAEMRKEIEKKKLIKHKSGIDLPLSYF